jgi:hypothetical protein
MTLLATAFLASLTFFAWHVAMAPEGRQDAKGFHVTKASPLVNHKRLTLALLIILNLALALARYAIS